MRLFFSICFWVLSTSFAHAISAQPNIVLIMADDQGWGQTSYNKHPQLKTPNLDAMAKNGIRFNRFYAAAPVCSPTRASVLTGRSPVRTGVHNHGQRLVLQEKTLPQALKKADYTTALFGKWHLNGVRGHGVPILGDDPYHPGRYGFDEWLSVTNFFDIDPLMSRNGSFEEFQGDSSELIVAEALKFIKLQKEANKPFLVFVWYGSPHDPFKAYERDKNGFVADSKKSPLPKHLGELLALDRSVGAMRKGLRDLGIEKDTLLWYCSDNGGLKVDPNSCGNLRGFKTHIYEGGIRVPGIIEWPTHIKAVVTDFPASTMDIFPTLVDLLGLPDDSMLKIRDGISLKKVIEGNIPKTRKAIPFLHTNKAALIDGDYKLVSENYKKGAYELYNLKEDQSESKDLAKELPELFEKMQAEMQQTIESIENSRVGKDYPEGKILDKGRSVFWKEMDEYKVYFDMFSKRPEYKKTIDGIRNPKAKKKKKN